MKRHYARAARTLSAIGISLTVLSATLGLIGCAGGYIEGDDGGAVVVAEPDVYLYGGYYDGPRGGYYGNRGYASRGYAGHPGGGPHGGGGHR